ncbi:MULTISPECIES: RICIN domain-containing protein [Bacillus cereus group]|nr:RICIN domain-containing protein [Bacillus thuringiensis]MCQ6336212.1 RICIN domain-containing protein [Bacillus cereus]
MNGKELEVFLGAFELGVRANSNLIIDVQNTSSGANLHLQERQNVRNSKWRVELYTGVWNPENLDVFVIYNVNDKQNVITFDDYNQALTLRPIEEYNLGQLWEIYDAGEEGWRFRSFEVPSLVIGTRDQKTAVGTDITAYNDNDIQTQLWTLSYDRKPAEGLLDNQNARYSIRTMVDSTFGIVNRDHTAQAHKITNLPDRKYQVKWDKNKQAYTIIQEVNNRKLALSFDGKSEEIVFRDFDAEELMQYWNIKYVKDKAYIIESLTRPSKCIDIWSDLGKILLFQNHGGTNQQWEFTMKHSDSIFDNQRVQFVPSNNSYYAATQTIVVDPQEGPQTRLSLDENADYKTTQGFLLKYDQTRDAYQIWNLDSSQILAWDYRNDSKRTTVFIHPNQNKAEHYWVLEELENQLFHIVNYANTGKVLDLEIGQTKNGSIILWDKKQDQISGNQKFYISTFELYDQYDGKGEKLLFTPNSQWNDKISSVRVPPYSSVRFWEHGGYSGKLKTIDNDSDKAKVFNLTDFNNIASSYLLYLNARRPNVLKNENTKDSGSIYNEHNPDSTYEIDREGNNITLNFYESTCNIFLNDDPHAEYPFHAEEK